MNPAPPRKPARKEAFTVRQTISGEHDPDRVATSFKASVEELGPDRCPSCGQLRAVAPATPVPVAPNGPSSYRVVKGGTFVQNGMVARVEAGHVVKTGSYGRDGIERMQKRGIVLEPLD